MTRSVELCVDSHSILGEGPSWDGENQVLYWVDIMGHKLHRYDPARRSNDTFDVGQPVGAVVPRRSGGVMLAVQHGFGAFDLDDEKLSLIADPEEHLPGNRFNDGKCDPAGRFWAGTMAFALTAGAGSLYRLDPDFTVHQMLSGVTISNGLAWSADQKTMYYIDSIPGTVSAFDYDVATGDVHDRRVVIDVPEAMGIPDGMTIDEEGMLWVAFYDGASVRRFDPKTAKVIQEVELPVSKVTSCAFGGAELDRLFITTASQQGSEEPHAGGLFVVEPGLRGVEAFSFGG